MTTKRFGKVFLLRLLLLFLSQVQLELLELIPLTYATTDPNENSTPHGDDINDNDNNNFNKANRKPRLSELNAKRTATRSKRKHYKRSRYAAATASQYDPTLLQPRAATPEQVPVPPQDSVAQVTHGYNTRRSQNLLQSTAALNEFDSSMHRSEEDAHAGERDADYNPKTAQRKAKKRKSKSNTAPPQQTQLENPHDFETDNIHEDTLKLMALPTDEEWPLKTSWHSAAVKAAKEAVENIAKQRNRHCLICNGAKPGQEIKLNVTFDSDLQEWKAAATKSSSRKTELEVSLLLSRMKSVLEPPSDGDANSSRRKFMEISPAIRAQYDVSDLLPPFRGLLLSPRGVLEPVRPPPSSSTPTDPAASNSDKRDEDLRSVDLGDGADSVFSSEDFFDYASHDLNDFDLDDDFADLEIPLPVQQTNSPHDAMGNVNDGAHSVAMEDNDYDPADMYLETDSLKDERDLMFMDASGLAETSNPTTHSSFPHPSSYPANIFVCNLCHTHLLKKRVLPLLDLQLPTFGGLARCHPTCCKALDATLRSFSVASLLHTALLFLLKAATRMGTASSWVEPAFCADWTTASITLWPGKSSKRDIQQSPFCTPMMSRRKKPKTGCTATLMMSPSCPICSNSCARIT